MLPEKNINLIPLTEHEIFCIKTLILSMAHDRSDEWTEELSEVIKAASGPFINYSRINNFLHMAISIGNLKIFNTLLNHPEIDINVKSGFDHDSTTLDEAITTDNEFQFQALKTLLAYPKINVNVQSKNGNTALHEVAEAGKVEAIKLLLTHPQIDPYLANKEGKIPGEYFELYVLDDQKEQVTKLLKDYREHHPRQETLEEINDSYGNIDLGHPPELVNIKLTGDELSDFCNIQ